MRCPFCREDEDRVVDSRTSPDGISIRRRRECERCGKRFTTYERIEKRSVRVVKKSGERVPFDREKLRSGLLKACHKRSVSDEQMESLIDKVEATLQETGDGEVDSHQIGELVMDELRALDNVAYVRFASVYRDFKDPREFMDELRDILEKK